VEGRWFREGDSVTNTSVEMEHLTFLAWDLIVSQLNYSLDNIYHIHRAVSALERVPDM